MSVFRSSSHEKPSGLEGTTVATDAARDVAAPVLSKTARDARSIAAQRKHRKGLVGVLLLSGVAALSMLMLVAMALDRTAPPTFPPTVRDPLPPAAELTGPHLITVEATAQESWRFFSLARGTLVSGEDPLGWDLAFRRFQVIVNGGAGFVGSGGVLDLGQVVFEEVGSVPTEGYTANTVRTDTTNSVLEDWYSYSYFSHLLSPKPTVYAIRSADGRYAKLQFLGYYCPGALPGCVTFRYVFQGGGGVELGNP